MSKLRLRFVIESAVAVTSFVAFLLTLLAREWIEIVFRVDPDHRSGLAEWRLAGGLLALALVALVLAAVDRQRLRSVSASAL